MEILGGAGANGGAGISPEAAVARNVTAVARGTESFGIEAMNISPFPGGSSMTLDLKNAIASGEGSDLAASGLVGTAKLLVTNSNFAKPFGESTISRRHSIAPLAREDWLGPRRPSI